MADTTVNFFLAEWVQKVSKGGQVAKMAKIIKMISGKVVKISKMVSKGGMIVQ